MKPALHKGQLIRWKDDRGFGFIQPDDGSQEVFLHITALKDVNRRPQVGDFICYQLIANEEGKGERGKGTPYLKAGVSNKDADFYRLACLKNLLFLFSIFKNRGFIPCEEKFFIPTLSPFPLPLFPFSVKMAKYALVMLL
jgi:cold shock CspA family protein